MKGGERRRYRRLTILFITLLFLYLAGRIMAARLHDDRYPPTITNSLSLDAKVKFLRRNRQLCQARTVVAGSSMCLNNLDAAYLNRTLPGAGPFVNLAAWGLQMDDIRFLLDFYLERAIRVQNVVLVGQIVDFRMSRNKGLFDRHEVWSYIDGKESVWFSLRHFDAVKAMKNWRTYDRLNLTDRHYEGLLFDETGSVMLDIPEPARNGERWSSYGLSTTTDPGAFRDLEKLCETLRGSGRRVIFLVPPVRPAFRRHAESVRALRAFKERAKEIVVRTGGTFIDADEELHLRDDCFIDMMHLNRRGARRVAELLAPLL